MARNRDYIPRPLAQFNEWYTNLINYIKKITFTQYNPWTPSTAKPSPSPSAGITNFAIAVGEVGDERGIRGEWSDILNTVIP